MKDAEIVTRRASNRELVQNMMNGFPPWSADEAQENKITVNVNWKEGPNYLHQARRQYENAFMKTGTFFSITLPDAPASKQLDYGKTLTNNVAHVMKNQQSETAAIYAHVKDSQFF